MKEYIIIGNGGYSKIVVDLIAKIGGILSKLVNQIMITMNNYFQMPRW